MNDLGPELAEKVKTLLRDLENHPAASRFLDGDVDLGAYAAFLGQTYLYVRQTRPLLRRAGEKLEQMGAYPALSALFFQKSEEEDGHERWALADLAAIGKPLDEASPPSPSPAVAAYLAWNHFQIEAGAPLGFLGTAYVLEALSSARAGAMAKNLLEKRQIPGIARGVSFLLGHAAADDAHLEALDAIFSEIDAAARSAIALSASVTASFYLGLLSDHRILRAR